MATKRPRRPRPYWHKDAKWVTGLLLVLVLGVTLLVYSLQRVTAEEPAVETLSKAMALALSRNGLDDETEITSFRQRLRSSPGGSIQPIPGLRITVREQDIAGLTPRQARLYLFRQLAEPLYSDGAAGLSGLSDDREMQQSISGSAGILGLLTLESHRKLQQYSFALGVLSALLALLLVFFSHRFGRLASPGLVLFLTGLPGSILFSFIAWAPPPPSVPPADDAGMTGMIGYVAGHIFPPLAEIISRYYLMALGSGLFLLALALIGKVIWRIARRTRSS